MADQDNEPKKPSGPPPLPGAGKPTPPPLPGAGKPAPPPLPSSGLPPMAKGSLPPLPGGLPPFKPVLPPGLSELMGETKSGAPPMAKPGLPAMPALPKAGTPTLPPLPGAAAAPAAPASFVTAGQKDFSSEKLQYEKKLSDLEKRLQEEREKLLIANLKSQEEQAAAARVEVSIKELQDKLRRERRDAEQEENRLKLEQKLQEMEGRLAQERETWVATLRNQMNARETQDKEIEAHFGLRIQEMERKWLEEKAQWQKLALIKDDEIRNLRALAERLKGADVELQKTVSEKKWLQERANELTMERGELMSRAQTAAEREKENIQLRADLGVSRHEVSVVQEKLERELQAVRMSSKEREERLLADLDRLQRDMAMLPERLKADHEAEIRRVKADGEAEAGKYKEQMERAGAELLKLRGIAGAFERQLAATKVQNSAFEKNQERYKAEFVVLQRKWVEREKEIRAEAQAQMGQMLEAEKTKIKILAQEEINQRAAKIAEQLEKERDADLKRAQLDLRAELEKELAAKSQKQQADWEAARATLEAEIARLHQELFKKDHDWSQRLLAKDTELHSTGVKADDFSSKFGRAEDERQRLEREVLELSKGLQASREEVGGLSTVSADLKDKLARLQKERDELAKRAEELERLATAQAAQVNSTQQTLDQVRAELARETHLVKLYVSEKEELAAKLKGEK